MSRALLAVAGSLALVPAAAGADMVTLGSTSGTPTVNLCTAGIECTYLPFNNVYSPALVVPFDGTVTSFAVNTASTAASVKLRVLRPASGGRFTGVGTSAPAPLTTTGVLTFATNLPVRTGDILGLDNDSSALLFDAGTQTTITAYYQLPSLGDGATGTPSNLRSPSRLLLSATVVSAPKSAGGGGGGGGGAPGGGPTAEVQCVVPQLRNLTLKQARKVLTAAACKLGKVSRRADRRLRRGRVLSQDPRAKWRREAGAKVDVKLSSGPPRAKR
jgi:hypothetical protein